MTWSNGRGVATVDWIVECPAESQSTRAGTLFAGCLTFPLSRIPIHFRFKLSFRLPQIFESRFVLKTDSLSGYSWCDNDAGVTMNSPCSWQTLVILSTIFLFFGSLYSHM